MNESKLSPTQRLMLVRQMCAHEFSEIDSRDLQIILTAFLNQLQEQESEILARFRNKELSEAQLQFMNAEPKGYKQ